MSEIFGDIKKIIFLGAQGSGKSTQAKLLSQKLGLSYIEMGQIFRDKAQKNDPDSGEIRQALNKGNLVPDHIAIKSLKERVAKRDCQNGYVLDGYPRNYAQLEGLEENIDKVFYIKIPENIGLKRLIDRARYDDNLDVITRRLEVYRQETEPVLAYFRQKGILEEIDGQKSIEEVHQDIVSKLANEPY